MRTWRILHETMESSCCSVLQCVAVCCKAWLKSRCIAVCRSVSQHAVVCCSVLQCAAVCTRHEFRFTGNLVNSGEIRESVKFGEIRRYSNMLQHTATQSDTSYTPSVSKYIDGWIHTHHDLHPYPYLCCYIYIRDVHRFTCRSLE